MEVLNELVATQSEEQWSTFSLQPDRNASSESSSETNGMSQKLSVANPLINHGY